jgi:sugar O-acyltransferase (sialic acid O-acetyltransferase NeuD family)
LGLFPLGIDLRRYKVKKKIIVIGTGGLAREFSSYFTEFSSVIDIVGFAGRSGLEHSKFSLPGLFFEENASPDIVGTNQAAVVVGTPALKRKLVSFFRGLGFEFPSIIHPSAVVSPRARVHEGVIVFPNCTVSPDTTLMPFSFLSFGVGIGHDSLVGPYVQINPGAQIGGFSAIGDGSLIGSGATILGRVRIGSDATVGSGSTVFSRVADSATVMGNPAKRMRAFEK